MKLSEAIRLGAMLKPQGFGNGAMVNPRVSCALGAALCAMDRVPADASKAYVAIVELWPWANEAAFACPFGSDCQGGYHNACHPPSVIVFHLNDFHHWTREQIADWIQTIEDAQTPPDPSCGSSEVAPEIGEATAVGVVATRT